MRRGVEMRKYVQAYNDALKSGLIQENTISKHVDQQKIIDQCLPESASFFYVIEIPSNRYRFLGKQQPYISGLSNEKFFEKGVELFLDMVHPEDVKILLGSIYPAISKEISSFSPDKRKKIQIQYNYRFRSTSGDTLNLMEQVYILELDDNGMPALLLGNVIMLDGREVLPIKLTLKIVNSSSLTATIFSKVYRSGTCQLEGVTKRELEILRNIAAGKTSGEIGEILFISRHTVDTHRRNLLKKLNCKSVVDLVRIAFNNGLL